MLGALRRLCMAVALVVTGGAMAGGYPPADRQSLNAHALRVMQMHDIAGMSIAVLIDDKRYYFNYGVAARGNGRLVDSNTLFEIGSLSKLFTATLAAYAHEQSKLRWSAHPGDYLPWLSEAPVNEATLLDLATHSSGGMPLQVPDEVETPAQLNRYFQTWQPAYPPGTGRTYSNPGIGLLGMAAASGLDLSYREALQTVLLPKLGLEDTCIDVPEQALSRYAQGYSKAGEPTRLDPGLLADEAYGLKSTSADLLRLIAVHLDPAKVEPELAAALAATRVGQFKVGPMTQALVWERYAYPIDPTDLLVGNSMDMALGTHELVPLDPLDTSDQAWINKTGSTDGFGAYLAMIPSKRRGVVILANKNYPAQARIRLALHALGEAPAP